ncbi:uncharacterized protein LOC130766640 [Actinidia eriantha]|uniref:uncharacterized protein LOC130766640 n=1 Tax=Actinidia eriantha TaxID=165200 RepID=UPI002590A66B|nr:uncharacterized protein LOC130766640 [Actinidia eriantha]
MEKHKEKSGMRAVPKFGGWDRKVPGATDYSMVFSQVRANRKQTRYSLRSEHELMIKQQQQQQQQQQKHHHHQQQQQDESVVMIMCEDDPTNNRNSIFRTRFDPHPLEEKEGSVLPELFYVPLNTEMPDKFRISGHFNGVMLDVIFCA